VDGEFGMIEVLLAFLKLGLTSFGGPMAHIGYFREEFVARRGWLDERTFAQLVGLCQFLPGPASSQLGFSIGLMRAGYPGGAAAWIGFTTPSAAALTAFAYGADSLGGPMGAALLHGLKLAAVAIVAQAVWGMARSLCPDRERASIALIGALIVLLASSPIAQVGAILMGGVLGLIFCSADHEPRGPALPVRVSRPVGTAALAAFGLILVGMPVAARLAASREIALLDAFYRSGALVFGGGHVVLPLLREAFVAPGWLTDDAFLAGYGAAQAVPGPLFTIAAYIGATVAPSPHRIVWAILGIVVIFLPGMLILLGALPFWAVLRERAAARASMRGVNAAVVGLLGAALYSPIWTTTIKTGADVALALAGFVLLTAWRTPPLLAVASLAGASIALARGAGL
jgi:chromate transporter